MLALIFKTINNNRKSILIYFLICALFVLMYTSIFPSIQKDADKMSELFESYPEAITKAFNVDENMFSKFENYIGAEHYSMIWPIMAVVLASSLAAGFIAGEVEKRTIQLLLSQPLSRSEIFFAKYISGTVLIFLFSLSTIILTLPLALIFGIDVDFSAHANMFITGLFFTISIFSIGMLVSSLSSSRGVVVSTTGGLMLIMYAVFILSSLQESVKNLKFFSLFYYYDYSNILKGNSLDFVNILVFLAIILVSSTSALSIFKKRDLAA